MSAPVQCPVHPDVHLIEDHRAGDLVCPACGLVVGDRLVDVGTEWRSFSNERSGNDPSRVGAPENPLLSGGDLSTTIAVGFGGSDSDNSLANAQRKSMNNTDRQMTAAMSLIREMSERIHLPRNIQENASRIFKDVLDSRALRGKNNEAQAAACLYIACRKDGVPRTFKEICAVSRVSKKEIGRCFKIIIRNLETNLEQITSADFMSRFCGNLYLPNSIQAAATRIAKRAVDMDLVAGRFRKTSFEKHKLLFTNFSEFSLYAHPSPSLPLRFTWHPRLLARNDQLKRLGTWQGPLRSLSDRRISFCTRRLPSSSQKTSASSLRLKHCQTHNLGSRIHSTITVISSLQDHLNSHQGHSYYFFSLI
ncbi:hypothetical protein B9Z55_018329 [Caenorhabditis nigoni]|uniref:Transcription initiation factor IIB n=1 Tax=Caenorhabditis nigoni TaxID=1611254 RepID=A0A2G5TDW7_9PELO|nr:hypothetical protein B9Z55_018329 [Caenorhabditis nigoni]